MSNLKYINYLLPDDKIQEKLNNKKQINIFVDLNSISKGFYNRTIILEELNYYADTKEISNKYITELREYLTNIYIKYKRYNPKFILFYDKGVTSNTKIDPNYKANRTNNSKGYIQTDDERVIYYAMKDYYFDTVYHKFKKPNLCSVIYLENVETDFIPEYVIESGSCNSLEKDTLNLILSVDKDLLQCCRLNNTYQAVCLYSTVKAKFEPVLYDNFNAMSYLTKTNSELTANYIPMLLAIAGDKSDNIIGVKGLGPVKTEKIIKQYNIENVNDIPQELFSEKDRIKLNFKLTSFKEQILRLTMSEMKKIDTELSVFSN